MRVDLKVVLPLVVATYPDEEIKFAEGESEKDARCEIDIVKRECGR